MNHPTISLSYFPGQARRDRNHHDHTSNFAAYRRWLALYWFEVDVAAFINDDGDISARLEANIAIQDVAALGVGSGVNDVELGLRLRYEIRREFAPYVGVNWSRKLGETADFARANFEDVGAASFVAGVRFWF